MKVLYLAIYSEGSTSKMRGEYLKKMLDPNLFKVIDSQYAQKGLSRLVLSLGWRFKIGPMIKKINQYIESELNGDYAFDLVWIDKGVFILPEIVGKLKKFSKKLVHFTPDPAFMYHRSDLFYKALPFYDFCITTKKFEVSCYESYGVRTLLTTQGFDPKVHRPQHDFHEKNGIVFIGHREKEREILLAALVKSGFNVTLAGINWKNFANKYKNYSNLDYRGEGLYGEDYAMALSKALIGLGLLSKWIPETHTTRTFEIPACKTLLATECNLELSAIFKSNEVLFFNDAKDLIQKIAELQIDEVRYQNMVESAYQNVFMSGYDYEGIMTKLLKEIVL